MVIFGMGEHPCWELAERLKAGATIDQVRDLPRPRRRAPFAGFGTDPEAALARQHQRQVHDHTRIGHARVRGNMRVRIEDGEEGRGARAGATSSRGRLSSSATVRGQRAWFSGTGLPSRHRKNALQRRERLRSRHWSRGPRRVGDIGLEAILILDEHALEFGPYVRGGGFQRRQPREHGARVELERRHLGEMHLRRLRMVDAPPASTRHRARARTVAARRPSAAPGRRQLVGQMPRELLRIRLHRLLGESQRRAQALRQRSARAAGSATHWRRSTRPARRLPRRSARDALLSSAMRLRGSSARAPSSAAASSSGRCN